MRTFCGDAAKSSAVPGSLEAPVFRCCHHYRLTLHRPKLPGHQGLHACKRRTRSIGIARNAASMVPEAPAGQRRAGQKVKVLFVCLGNICRSPTAEAVFRAVVERAGEAGRFLIDSCGTGGGNPEWYKEGGWAYHEGDESDRRMKAAASKRGVCLTSRSRPLTPEDVKTFDHIIGMDHENIATIQLAVDCWAAKDLDIPRHYRSKVQLMCKYLDSQGKFKGILEVPDPYYGGAKGFELVLDLLEDACEGLLRHILEHDLASAAL